MRELVDRYLSRRLSRRGFVNQMARWGFSAAATASNLESLQPLARAESADGAPQADESARVVRAPAAAAGRAAARGRRALCSTATAPAPTRCSTPWSSAPTSK
jgi:hypothetical protein